MIEPTITVELTERQARGLANAVEILEETMGPIGEAAIEGADKIRLALVEHGFAPK